MFAIVAQKTANAAEEERAEAALRRGLVMRYARGNLRLQLGRYLTKEQIDADRARALAHKF